MRATVDAIEIALPSRILSNEEVAYGHEDWTPDKVESKTGIRQRRIAETGEMASDLAVAAALKLFASGVCSPSEVDFVLLCTQSPDYLLPTTACLVQHRLGIPTSAGALDINLGCSGFIYGLSLAKGLIETGQARTILFLTADTYSKFLHPGDRSVRSIFGDGAAATLIRATDASSGIGPFVFGTDGSGGPNLIVPTSGLREPRTEESAAPVTDASGNTRTGDNLFMNGSEIFAFTLKEVPRAVNALLAKCGATADDVDLFVFHQANEFMLEHLRKKMKIPPEKFLVYLRDVGNTVSSTIPIALHDALRTGRVKPGTRLVLVGFGVGYSWAACMLTWGRGATVATPTGIDG